MSRIGADPRSASVVCNSRTLHIRPPHAVASLLGKLDTFRGESRFTSWAYRFVALEVSNKLSRHFSRRSPASLDVEGWKRLPARFGADPLALTQQRELNTAVQWAMREALTDHQRQFLIAIVVNGVPIDAMVSQSGSNRGAIYRTVLEARRKIRAYLAANGYLGREPATQCNDQPRGHLTAIPER